MRIECRSLARTLIGVFVWGFVGSIFAQEREALPPKSSEAPHRMITPLGSARFDVGGSVASVAWSPDGRFLATLADANRVALWNAETGQQVWQKNSILQSNGEIRFSSGGKILIHSGASGHSAFEVGTGQAVDLETDEGKSADRMVIIHRGEDRKQLLLKEGQKEKRKITLSTVEPNDGFARFRLSPHGHYLVTGSSRGQLTLWNVRDGRRIRDFGVPRGGVVALEFTSDGKLLVAASAQLGIYVFDVESGKRRHVLETPRIAFALAVDPQGKRLVSAEQGGQSAKIWNLKTGALEREVPHPVVNVRSIAFSPDGSQVVLAGSSGSGSGELGFWEVASGRKQREAPGHDGPVIKLTFSPDGRRLATAAGDQTVCLWEARTGKLLTTCQGDASGDLRFSPDGWLLGAAGQFGSYRLWEVSSGDLLVGREPIRNAFYGRKSCFSPDLGRFAFCSTGGRLGFIETATAKQQPPVQVFDKIQLGTIAFSPNGAWLAVASDRNLNQNPPQDNLLLWDMIQNKPGRKLTDPILMNKQSHYERIERLEFSPDGRTLAAVHSRQQLFLWELSQGTSLHAKPINSGRFVTFTPDGKTLLRLSIPETDPGKPRSARIEWIEVATAGIYRTLDLENSVSAIALSPDGRLLAGALDKSRQVLLWELSPPASSQPRSNADLKQAVDLLTAEDAQKGRNAMALLIAAGDTGVPMLSSHLKLITEPEQAAKDVQQLIRNLDHDEFFTREKASNELQALGSRIVPTLKSELERKPSLEATRRIQSLLKRLENTPKPHSGDSLRRIRSIEILERIGSVRAQEILKQMANGPASSPDADDAMFALKRIQNLNPGH